MGVETKNTQRLGDMLKQNKDSNSFDYLKEAFKEVEKEEGEKKKGAAKELIRKCLELKGRMDGAEREFNAQKKKCDKELGKLLNRLNNMAQGKPLDEGEEKEEDKEGGNGGDSSNGESS